MKYHLKTYFDFFTNMSNGDFIMKTIKLVSVIASVLFASSAAAVDLSTTITNGTTNSVRDVNQTVTGSTYGMEFEYSQNRGGALDGVNGNNCQGATCGTGNDALNVGLKISATERIGTIDQLTTGAASTVTENCDVSVAIGGLSNSQGTRTATSTSTLETANNNLTQINSGTIEVSTQTDKPYTGGWGNSSKPGNDISINIGGHTVSSEGDNVAVMDLAKTLVTSDLTQVTIGGQDLNSADMNQLNVSVNTEALQVKDLSKTTVNSTTVSTTVFENLN